MQGKKSRSYDLRRLQRLSRKGKDVKMSSFILTSFPLRGFCLFVVFTCLKFFAERRWIYSFFGFACEAGAKKVKFNVAVAIFSH